MRTADPELHERRRTQILQAAAECVIAHGFHQASMAEIAQAAGLSMGLLYRYFRNKEAMIVALAARDREQTLSGIAQFAASSDPLSGLASLFAPMVREALDPAYARMALEVAAEAGRNTSLMAALVADDRAVRDALREALRSQQAAGRLRADVDASHLASVLIAQFEGLPGRALVEPDLDPALCTATLAQLLQNALRP